jgi:uncharacterized DUF497 family protein
MRFDWDQKKATLNRIKHGVSFDIAITAFDDPNALIAKDEKHSTGVELRESLIGESDKGVLVIIFTIREPGNIYRIISARKANKKERSLYEVFKGV